LTKFPHLADLRNAARDARFCWDGLLEVDHEDAGLCLKSFGKMMRGGKPSLRG
jgi:hypothetical protein